MKTIVQFSEEILKPYINDEDNKFAANIAPVEEDATSASQGYAVGQQLILDGVLYDVIAAITAGDALATTGAGANISAADDVTTQIADTNTELSSVKQALANEAETRAKLGAHNLFDLEGWLNEKGVTYTKSGNSYTFTVGANTGNNNAYKFSSTPITVDLSSTITAGTALNVGFRFIKNGEVVSQKIINGTIEADSVYIDYSSAGTATITDVMLKLHTDSYSGFTPYAPTNAQLLSYKDNGVLGAKNLLPFDLAKIKSANTIGTWSNNAYTIAGITYTVNSDGTISAQGTATDTAQLQLALDNNAIPYGTYILSGFPSGLATADTTYIRLLKNNNTQIAVGLNSAIEATVTFDNSNVSGTAFISIARNTVISNAVVFKPMLRLASDTDTTYQPYAMTNRELTDEFVSTKWETITGITGVILSGRNVGDVVSINVQIPEVSFTASTWNDIATGIASKFIPLAERRVIALISGGTMCYLRVTTEGKIQVYPLGASSGSMSFTLTYIR